jgi:hypothetical protein
MSREIKFRIWHEETKRFIEDDVDVLNREGYNLGQYALTPSGKVVFFESQEGGMATYYIDEDEVEVILTPRA